MNRNQRVRREKYKFGKFLKGRKLRTIKRTNTDLGRVKLECNNGKIRYVTFEDARIAQRKVLEARKQETRIYPCPICHDYHLTSQV